MRYILNISEDAEQDILFLRKSGEKTTLLKLNQLLNELREHPYIGTGKPKPLYMDEKDNGHDGLHRNIAWFTR